MFTRGYSYIFMHMFYVHTPMYVYIHIDKDATIYGIAPAVVTILSVAWGLCRGPMCMEMNMIVAIEMSTVPFKTFKFVPGRHANLSL